MSRVSVARRFIFGTALLDKRRRANSFFADATWYNRGVFSLFSMASRNNMVAGEASPSPRFLHAHKRIIVVARNFDLKSSLCCAFSPIGGHIVAAATYFKKPGGDKAHAPGRV